VAPSVAAVSPVFATVLAAIATASFKESALPVS